MSNSGGQDKKDERAILRREKENPCADYWHTLRIGLPIAAILFLLLPFLMS